MRMVDASFADPSWELTMARKDARLMLERELLPPNDPRRATYDAAQEIRSRDITRDEGVSLVKRFDGAVALGRRAGGHMTSAARHFGVGPVIMTRWGSRSWTCPPIFVSSVR